MIKKNLGYCLFLFIFLAGCNTEKDAVVISKTLSLYPQEDLTIINSDPAGLADYFEGENGKELRIGWDSEGHAMRTFLSFDVHDMIPSYDEELEIDSAVLKVYEADTRLLPFNNNRSVLVSLIDNQGIVAEDFNAPVVGLCGIIASNSFGERNEYFLDVTQVLNSYFSSKNQNTDCFLFRLQFNSDGNITNTETSSMDGSSWNIYAREAHNDFVPLLQLRYTLKSR